MMSVFIERLVLKVVISFVVTEISKLKTKLDWKSIKIGAEKHVRDLVPGTWFDDQAVAFVDAILDAIQEALSHGKDIQEILTLLGKKDIQGAIDLIKKAVIEKIGHQVPFAEKEVTIREMLA